MNGMMQMTQPDMKWILQNVRTKIISEDCEHEWNYLASALLIFRQISQKCTDAEVLYYDNDFPMSIVTFLERTGIHVFVNGVKNRVVLKVPPLHTRV